MLHQRLKDAVCGRGDGDWPRWCLFCRGLSLVGCSLLGGSSSVAATEPLTLAPPGSSDQVISTSRQTQARASIQWLASLALSRMPQTLEGDRDWGKTKQVWSGVKVRFDGLQLKTKRRYRRLEQGRWVKYAVTLPNPKTPDAARVTIHRVEPVVAPSTGQQRWDVESSVVAPMKFTARVQRWNLGVKLFSMTISGDVRVRLQSSTSIGFHAKYSEIPPALVLDPHVKHAHLYLERFEVDRVSHIGGDVAEQWGELIEEVLVDRLVRKQNDRLASKLNRAIEKERDSLRISLADWLADWHLGQVNVEP